jgi:hypothetical protein
MSLWEPITEKDGRISIDRKVQGNSITYIVWKLRRQ